MLRFMNGRRDKGGSRISETKEVTTVVNAAAMLCYRFSCVLLSRQMKSRGVLLIFKMEGEERGGEAHIKPTATSKILSYSLRLAYPLMYTVYLGSKLLFLELTCLAWI